MSTMLHIQHKHSEMIR